MDQADEHKLYQERARAQNIYCHQKDKLSGTPMETCSRVKSLATSIESIMWLRQAATSQSVTSTVFHDLSVELSRMQDEVTQEQFAVTDEDTDTPPADTTDKVSMMKSSMQRTDA